MRFRYYVLALVISAGCSPQTERAAPSMPLDEPVWLRTDGTDQGLGIAHRLDGGLVMVGRTQGGLGEDDGFVLSIGSDGSTDWVKTLGSSGVDVLLDVGVHPDGTIIAGGVSTGNYEDEQNDLFSDGALSALSSSGEVLWSRLLGLGAMNQLVVLDDGVVVTGSGFQAGAQDADAFVAKYNLSGEALWHRWLRSSGNDSATGITSRADELWVVGFTDGALFDDDASMLLEGWVAVLRDDGTLMRGEQRRRDQEHSLTRICETPQGQLVLAGYVIDGAGEIDSLVEIYDASHSELFQWRSYWPGSDALYGLVCKRDGTIAVSGRLDTQEQADGFWVHLSSELSVLEHYSATFPGRDEWVDGVEVDAGLCFSGYRPFDDNPVIDDLDAVAQCY